MIASRWITPSVLVLCIAGAAVSRVCFSASGPLPPANVTVPASLSTSAPSNSTAASSPSADDRTVTFDAGYSKWLSAPHTVEMSQGVAFQQGQAVLKTDAAIVYLDSGYHASTAKSLSPVHMYDPSNDLIGDAGEIDFVHHIATLHGHVVLVTQRKIPGETTQTPATLSCDAISYDYRSKIGTVPGPLTVQQTDRTLYADSGVYNTAAQTITLTGNVHGHDTKGNQLAGPEAVVIVTPGKEAVTLQGPIHGSFPVSDEDNPTATSNKK